MEIEYTVTRDDFGKAQARLLRLIPRFRRALLGVKLFSALVIFVAVWFILGGSILLAAIPAVAFFVVLSLPLNWITPQIMKRMPKEGQGILGLHKIRIADDGLYESTEVNETKAAWKAVSMITSDRYFVYIVIGDAMAHAIPVPAFKDITADAFEAEARRLWENNR